MFLFYLGMYFINLLVLKVIMRDKIQNLFGYVLLGVWLGILPPILDLFNPNILHQTYDYIKHFDWNLVSIEESYGESITVWLWIFLFTGFVYYKKRNLLIAIVSFFSIYLVVQLVAFYSGLIVEKFSLFILHRQNSSMMYAVWWLSVSFFIFSFLNYFEIKTALFRAYHSLIWPMLIFLGSKMAVSFYPDLNVIMYLMFLNFICVLCENDYYDKELDEKGDRFNRIDVNILVFCYLFQLSITFIMLYINTFTGLCFILFNLITFYYHYPSLRLKKHFITSSFCESFAAFICLLIGGLSKKGMPENQIMMGFYILIAFAFYIISNIKDYKDIKSDDLGGINTIYVYFSKRGYSYKKVTQIFSNIIIFILILFSLSYMLFSNNKMNVFLLMLFSISGGVGFRIIKKPKNAFLYLYSTILVFMGIFSYTL